jgi:hypothetical protein
LGRCAVRIRAVLMRVLGQDGCAVRFVVAANRLGAERGGLSGIRPRTPPRRTWRRLHQQTWRLEDFEDPAHAPRLLQPFSRVVAPSSLPPLGWLRRWGARL